MKDLSIIQTVPTRKGYLEKMGLVEMELKVSTWFMNICSDAVLVPQLYESSQVSMENLSLSPNCILECVKEGNNDEISSNLLETNNNLQEERDKFYNTLIRNAQSAVPVDNSPPLVVPNVAAATVVRQNDSMESLKSEGEP